VDGVRGGGDEDRPGVVALLHPGEQGPDHTGGDPTVEGAAAGGTCGPLFDLVDPEDAGGHGGGDLEGRPQVGLGLADKGAVDPAHVEPEQRQVPRPGGCLGGERLAAPLDPEQQDAAWGLQAEVSGFLAEGPRPAAQPVLQEVEAAHVVQGVPGVVVLQDPCAAEGLGLLLVDGPGSFLGPGAVADEGEGEGVLGFGPGEACRCLHKEAAGLPGDGDGGAFGDVVGDALDVLPVRQRVVENEQVLFEFRGDHQPGA
jgi:hypothetical protein